MTPENNPELDVGTILQQLRDEIRNQRLAQGNPEPTALERELRQSLDDIELYRVVSAHWPLKSKSVAGKFAVLINKVVRRFLRWYINPIVEQQNAYNDAVARSLQLLAEAYTELGGQGSGIRDQGSGTRHWGLGIGDQQPGSPPDSRQQTPDTGSGEQESSGEAEEPQPPAPLPVQPQYLAAQQLAAQPQHHWQSLVAQRAQQEPPASFIELKLAALQPQLALRQNVVAHWPLEGRSTLERGAAFIHKLMRQYLRWLINPIVEQQNHANSAMTRVITLLVQLDEQRRAEIARQRARR